MSAPGWQTGELIEEWVETSPSPPTINKPLPTETLPTLDADSIRAKRGSLRALGHSAARALPSRSTSTPRVISGHSEGRILSERYDNQPVSPNDGGLLSPPSSSGENEPVAGTFVVKEGVDDDRGKHLARHKGGRDMFGPTALEKMFQPPSPPQPATAQTPSQPQEPLPSTTPSPVHLDAARRASHPYAPANPSRLSKSVTPTTASGSSFSASQPLEFQDVSDHAGDTSPDASEDVSRILHDDEENAGDAHDLLRNGEVATDVSPIASGAKYPFTFEAPIHSTSDTKSNNDISNPFDPALSPFNYGEASHSTLQRGEPSHTNSKGSPRGSSKGPGLRLFRSTYDTYTREHLSALVDSIAIEPSPSPPSLPNAQDLREWSPEASPSYARGSGSERSASRISGDSEDARSSKRMRMSPSSPGRRAAGVRDWGAQGRNLNRQRGSGSGDQGDSSRSVSREYEDRQDEDLKQDDDDYHDVPPFPPLAIRAVDRPTHRSNPSTNSSGYLRAAEELMAKIRARPVSESSASGIDQSGASPTSQQIDTRSMSNESLGVENEDLGQVPPVRMDDPEQRFHPSTNSSGYLRAAEELMAKIRARPVSESSASGIDQSPGTFDSRIPSVSTSEWESAVQELRKNKGKGKSTGPSPRRILRRLSASEEVKRAADGDSSSDDQNQKGRGGSAKLRLAERRPTSQASSARDPPTGRNNDQVNADDLNRFVSATTAITATTMSTSFVKHPGPRQRPTQSGAAMRVIKPDDLNGIVPDRVGKMKYDKVSMRWVRDGLGRVEEATESRGSRSRSEESEDVFAGMDSWGRSDGRQPSPPVEPIPEAEVESSASSSDEDEANLNRHADTTHIVDDQSDCSSNSSRSEDDFVSQQHSQHTFPTNPTLADSPPHRPLPHHANSAPAVMTPTPNLSVPPRPIRSALRNTNSLTPGMKKRAQWHESVTPAPGSSARRSVSFSDGKKSGKIQGLHPDVPAAGTDLTDDGDGDWFRSKDGGEGKSWLPSARTKRIEGILGDLEELSLDEGTPSKPPRPLIDSPDTIKSEGDTTIRQGSGGHGHRSFRARADANATFLTECSFGVAHDRLVQLITDVYGSEPYWEHLKILDLRGKGTDSVARLKEFLPDLEEVNLNDNKISYLSGIPSGVRSLHVANNRLSSLTSVDHLRNLQVLDVSTNQLDSVTQLACLKQLRELKADGNSITDLSGLMQMSNLVKLSVVGNKITQVDLKKSQWQQMQSLNLSNNRIQRLDDLDQLISLRELVLDGNEVTELGPSRAMSSMRSIKISDNDLTTLDLSLFPKLRTLYADRNSLKTLNRSITGVSRLENLSLRNQNIKGLHLSQKELENVQRLYISGNALGDNFFPSTPLHSLVYLEAAACNLTRWPRDMSRRMPKLKILNVNYNYFENLDGISGSLSLRKISLVGGRLGAKDGKGVMSGLKGLEKLEEIDLRMNPSTLGFYLPLILPASKVAEEAMSPPARQNPLPSITLATIRPSIPETGVEWAELDGRFRRGLPDEWYGKRLVYRGLVMGQCPRLRILDGIRIEEGERRKAERLLEVAGGY